MFGESFNLGISLTQTSSAPSKNLFGYKVVNFDSTELKVTSYFPVIPHCSALSVT